MGDGSQRKSPIRSPRLLTPVRTDLVAEPGKTLGASLSLGQDSSQREELDLCPAESVCVRGSGRVGCDERKRPRSSIFTYFLLESLV